MVPLAPLVIELGLATHRDIFMEAGYERLCPEWPYLVKTTGEIKHGHYLRIILYTHHIYSSYILIILA